MASEPCGAPLPDNPRKHLLWEALEFTCDGSKGHNGPHSTAPEPVSEIKVVWPNDGSDVYVRNSDVPCEHANTWASVDITHLSDSGATTSDITAGCQDCGTAFLFPATLVVGLSLSGITRSFDRKELRVSLTPESQVMP